MRCLVRDPKKLTRAGPSTEVMAADVMDPSTFDDAFEGVDTAYYLIHLMESGDDFEGMDRKAANHFATAAMNAGVRRLIYLGGLGDEADLNLSPHLRSRHEVGRILRSSGIQTIEFRASVVIGDGSLSFDLIRSLTERLPVMICPRWLATDTQPIAISDLLVYLLSALDLHDCGNEIFEIGGRDVVTYGRLIQEYADQSNLRRWLISVPLLTPYLSSLWLGLVTPTSATVARHLIEGLKNPTIVRDKKAETRFNIQPQGITESVRLAIEQSGKQQPAK